MNGSDDILVDNVQTPESRNHLRYTTRKLFHHANVNISIRNPLLPQASQPTAFLTVEQKSTNSLPWAGEIIFEDENFGYRVRCWHVATDAKVCVRSVNSYTAYAMFHSLPLSSLLPSCSHLLFSTASLSFAMTSLGSLAPNTALPATMTFAPASAAVSIVLSARPPSTSMFSSG